MLVRLSADIIYEICVGNHLRCLLAPRELYWWIFLLRREVQICAIFPKGVLHHVNRIPIIHYGARVVGASRTRSITESRDVQGMETGSDIPVLALFW